MEAGFTLLASTVALNSNNRRSECRLATGGRTIVLVVLNFSRGNIIQGHSPVCVGDAWLYLHSCFFISLAL